MPQSDLLMLDPEGPKFRAWLTRKGCRRPLATVLHNTWSPTAAQYHGRDTIRAIEQYHMQTRHFSTIAANAYAVPTGMVVTGRSLTYANWAHALISRDDVEAEARAIAAGDEQWFNKHAFGLEVVANFDRESCETGPSGISYRTAMRVLAVVHELFGIPSNRLFFHRDVANKTCPGLLLNRALVRRELADMLREMPRVLLAGRFLDVDPTMAGDRMTVDGSLLLNKLGVTSKAARALVHANGRAFVGELKPYLLADGWTVEYEDTASGPELRIERAVRL